MKMVNKCSRPPQQGIKGFSSIFFTKGCNFCDFLFASMGDKALPKRGSAPKRMNLLLHQ